MEEIFTEIYKQNHWKNDESVSGKGSTLENTLVARTALRSVIGQYGVKSMLDIPCGDFNWMKELAPSFGEMKYIGADIVEELVYENRDRFRLDFRVLDVTQSRLPEVDLVFCRDMFGHFTDAQVKQALLNIRRSGSKYLMATTFPGREENQNIRTGEWRPINLDYLFGLPDPILMINEQYEEGNGEFNDKSLGLWRLNDE